LAALGVEFRGLVLARQVLYHLSHIPALIEVINAETNLALDFILSSSWAGENIAQWYRAGLPHMWPWVQL
jgi:hypothetical protein